MPPPRRTRIQRNLQSAASEATRSSLNLASKAIVSTFKWASTDHTRFSRAMSLMPEMGLWDSVEYIMRQLATSVVTTLIGAVWVFLLIAYVLPYLITI